MRVNKKKRQAYRPSDHVISRESAVSSILGAIGIFGYLILVGASFQAAGNGGILLGAAAWVLFGISVFGMMLAVRSYHDTASIRVWKVVGSITNGAVLLFSAALFVIGLI